MNLLKLMNGVHDWEFQIDKTKYIISSTDAYFPLIQTLKQLNIKEKSEHRLENNYNAKICFDERELDLRRTLILELSDSYSLLEDRKLNSKSLMLKYLELQLQSQDYVETIATMDILLSALAQEVNETSILKIQFDSTGFKQLIKMANPFFESGLQMDEYDLSLDELVSLQIKMIDYLTKHQSKFDHIIIYAKLDCLSSQIIKELDSLQKCHIIIVTRYYQPSMRLNDICLMQKNLVDLANIEIFYKQFMKQSCHYFMIEEVKSMIERYLTKTYTYKETDIYQELEHFLQEI